MSVAERQSIFRLVIYYLFAKPETEKPFAV